MTSLVPTISGSAYNSKFSILSQSSCSISYKASFVNGTSSLFKITVSILSTSARRYRSRLANPSLLHTILADATSKHFDLRLHIAGGLFSFAIPRGLSASPSNSTSTDKQNLLSRLAVETSIHPLNYALFEGVGRTGITAVWDIGEYRVSFQLSRSSY